MHVPDLAAALRWFGLLGFRTRFEQSNYAYVEREGAGVRLMQSTEEDGTPFPPHRGFSIYLDVADVDAIVAEIRPKLAAAKVETMGPVDQDYAQREFMVRAPDGNVLVFGQALGPSRRTP
jgi:catechol 2,3-dioxygenase-like lactoylglutathione lyase family enzyme